MASFKNSLSLKKAELVFEDDGITVIETHKDGDITNDLVELLRRFEGCQNLTISVSVEKEI